MDKPDLLIIGLDRLGLDLAMAASALGASVVLAMQGETALDHALRDGEMLARMSGLALGGEASFQRARTELAQWIRCTRSPERLRAARVIVEPGHARFVDHRRVAIGDRVLSPRRIVIATGRRGGEAVPLFLENGKLPRRVRISGADEAGLALAALLLDAGVKVNLAAQAVSTQFDADMANLFLEHLERQGLSRSAASVKENVALWPAPDLVPALDGMEIGNAGLSLARGALSLGAHLEAGRGRIFAIGTVCGTAFAETPDPGMVGYLLARLLFRKPGRYRPPVAVRSIGAQPALAAVGLGEDVARRLSREISIYRAHSGEIGADPSEATMVKLICDRAGTLLGASLLSAQAPALATCLALAIDHRLGVEALGRLTLPAGSAADTLRQAALAPQRARLRAPGLQRALRFLRRFG